MANQGISIKYDAKKALQLTGKTVDRMSKNNTIMDVIAIMAWKGVLDNFKNEEGKKRPWPKWSKKLPNGTRKFYSTRPYGRGGSKLLQDTGLLRNSIRPISKNNEAHVYTRTKYAGAHQFGTKNIPKRDFMWIAQKKINEMSRKFINWIVTGRK